MTTKRRYELSDNEWERLKKYYPAREAGQLGRPRSDDRQLLNGVLWVLRSGAPWRDVPERGVRFTIGSFNGRKAAFLLIFLKSLAKMPTFRMLVWIVAASKLTSIAQVLKRGGRR